MISETGIYTIKNASTGKVYVGSAVDVKRRWQEHRQGLSRNSHYNQHLQRAWNKYGASAFVFEIILHCAKEFLIQWEQITIDGHISTLGRENLYNISPTAQSLLGATWSWTEESRKRKSDNMTGSLQPWHSLASRAKRSVSLKGRKRAPEVGQKISKTRTGRPGTKWTPEARVNHMASMTSEVKRKIGQTLGEYYKENPVVCTAIARANMRAAQQKRSDQDKELGRDRTPKSVFKHGHVPWNKGTKGYKQTQEHIASSQAAKKKAREERGYWHSQETIQNMRAAWAKKTADPNYIPPVPANKGKPSPLRGTKKSEQAKANMRAAWAVRKAKLV